MDKLDDSTNLPMSMAKYMLKHYGFTTFVKSVIFFLYRKIKRKTIDISKTHILDINGYKMSVMPNDEGISTSLLMFKTHEPLTTQLISKILKKGMYCIDIGSNIGYYALLENKIVGNEGRIVSIEPSPTNFKLLKENILLQNSSNMEAYNFAAGNKKGTVKFMIDTKSNWCKVVDDDEVSDNVIDIESNTLDNFLEKLSIRQIDFLRMDVEGFEANIIEGAQKTIQKFKPILAIEIHKNFMGNEKTKTLLQNLMNMRYQIKHFSPRELDVPIVGNLDDTKPIHMEEIIKKFNGDFLPDVFNLIMINEDYVE
jgi:FkbM family methyltransferase